MRRPSPATFLAFSVFLNLWLGCALASAWSKYFLLKHGILTHIPVKDLQTWADVVKN